MSRKPGAVHLFVPEKDHSDRACGAGVLFYATIFAVALRRSLVTAALFAVTLLLAAVVVVQAGALYDARRRETRQAVLFLNYVSKITSSSPEDEPAPPPGNLLRADAGPPIRSIITRDPELPQATPKNSITEEELAELDEQVRCYKREQSVVQFPRDARLR